jgi:hypothetical protein
MIGFNLREFVVGLSLVAACGPGKAESDSETEPNESIGTCMGNLSCGVPTDECAAGVCSTSTCAADGCEATCSPEGCELPTTCAADGCGDSTTEAAPSSCAPGTGDLSVMWEQTDAAALRGEAVAAGAGRVAWMAGDFMGTRLRVQGGDGEAVWDRDWPAVLGEAELTFKDLAIQADGGVVLAWTAPMQGVVEWFDADGMIGAGHYGPASEWSGVALAGDGEVVVAGSQDDDMVVCSFEASNLPAWCATFAEMGAAWSSDIFAATGQLLVSGHSNESPGPVLAAYDLTGALQWSVVDPGGPLELGLAVTGDATGRVFLAVTLDDVTGRIDRFDAGGTLETSFDLEYGPRALAVDADGRLVIAGARPLGEETVMVERRTADGELVAEHSRPGWRALGLAVDADCRAYVVGDAPDGAYLAKLN